MKRILVAILALVVGAFALAPQGQGRAAPITTNLFVGWNIFAYVGFTQPVPDALDQIDGKYNVVWRLAGQSQSWSGFDPSAPPFLNDLEVLEQFGAYMINMRQAGALTFDIETGGPSPDEELPTEPEPERVQMLYDDLQNGRFDAFRPAPGAEGTYSVVDDGGGNLVALLSDNMRLGLHDFTPGATTWQNYEMTIRVKRGAVGQASFGFRWNANSQLGYWLSNSGDEWVLSKQTVATEATLHTVTRSTPVDTWFQLKILVRTSDGAALIEANLDSEPLLSYTDSDPIAMGGIQFGLEGTGAELRLDDLGVMADVDSRYTWRQTGGPFGGWLSDIAVDPTDWRTAYVGTGDGGAFKTTDGGATWAEIGLTHGLWKVRIRNIELAPSDPSVVYVGVGGKHVSPLWRSDDGGATWRWTGAGDIDDGLYREADLYAIGIDPTDPMHIFVGLGADGVFESTDGGTTLIDLGSGGGEIQTITVDPSDPAHILAAPADPATSAVSVLRSTDGGATWVPSDVGLGGSAVRQFLFYPPDPTVVFALPWGPQLFRSTDGGESWSALEGVPGINALRFSGSGPGMLVAFFGGGVFVSTDQGDSWTPMEGNPQLDFIMGADVGTDDPRVIYMAAEMLGVAVSTDLGTTWRPSVTGLRAHAIGALAVDPSDPATVYAGGMDGLYKSTDFGETWRHISRGLGQGAPTAVTVDPGDSNVVHLAQGQEGGAGELFKSTDGGSTWRDVTGDVSYSVSALAIDPNNSSTIFAGTGGGPQSGPQGRGLYRSSDGGETWTKLEGIPDVSAPAVVVDSLDSAHIAVGTMGYGVYVSFDGGDTFEQRNNGMDDTQVSRMIYALAMNPENPDIMYAGTNSWYGFGVNRPEDPNVLYKTTDGGLNWVELLRDWSPTEYPFATFGGGVDTITIVPGHPDWVYVGMHDPGVIFTDNGGTDWRWAHHGMIPLLTHVYPYRMAISPDGQIMYSGGCGRSVFRNRLLAAEE